MTGAIDTHALIVLLALFVCEAFIHEGGIVTYEELFSTAGPNVSLAHLD
jgi:hypothetical protein